MVITLAKLRRQLSQALDAALTGEPVVISDYRRPVAILLALPTYEHLSGQHWSLSEQAFLAAASPRRR